MSPVPRPPFPRSSLTDRVVYYPSIPIVPFSSYCLIHFLHGAGCCHPKVPPGIQANCWMAPPPKIGAVVQVPVMKKPLISPALQTLPASHAVQHSIGGVGVDAGRAAAVVRVRKVVSESRA